MGTPDFRIFIVHNGDNLTLNDLTILGGQDYSSFGGGGVLNFGRLTLTGDTFIDNSRSTGRPVNDGGTVTCSATSSRQLREPSAAASTTPTDVR